MLAETSTMEISETTQPKTFSQNMDIARQGGDVANAARRQLEQSTGKSAVSSLNAKEFTLIT